MNIFIGKNIKRLRNARNITQEQLGNILNVSTAAVCKWETNETYPDILLLPKIAYYFKVTIDDLVGYDEMKIAEETEEILIKYELIPAYEKYNGKCQLINDARIKYPNDYRIAEKYMYDLVGGYADNDPSLLILHSDELLKICNEINNNCNDLKIRINALTMEAKILNAKGKIYEALEILNKLPSFYHSSNQKKEQLYAKGSLEYFEILNDNFKEIGNLFGDKLAKILLYNPNLTLEEKNSQIENLKEYFEKANVNKIIYFNEVRKQFMARTN